MSQEKIHFIIDGTEIEAEEGQTIMQAADAAGIYIPRLCYHPDLPPGGHCRVCTVKVNGRPASSCTFPAGEGIVVEANSEELTALRRTIVEMLFAEGNHVCPSCEASGDCELQAQGYRLGLLATTMPYVRMRREVDASHKDVYIDRDRCILCGRCARASELEDGKTVFAFEGRGINKRIAVDGDALAETPMAATDKAARICPTGSLVVKREGYRTPVGKRPYDKTPIGADIESKRA
jgi:[NiFe] hydrogenase diaphorase moiety small subunit